MKEIILLYGHGGSGNHGCEALARSTCQIISRHLTDSNFYLATPKPNEDTKYGLDHLCSLENIAVRKKNLDYYLAYLGMKLTGNYVLFDIYPYAEFSREHPDSRIAISIGGDNYCYGDNQTYSMLNKLFRKSGKKTVLWGCSIEPDILDSAEVIADMKRYAHIVARESITYAALCAKGLKHISLYPDPAFTLQPESCSLPEGMTPHNTVVINVSPMIIGCEQNQGITLKSYQCLIQHIIDNTDMDILLLPHVVWSNNDDRQPLSLLYEHYKASGRVYLFEDHSAPQLKYAISLCRFAVVARTHASVAAYSTCIPTLVVGYSVKARGIAKDIFGADEHYVIPVQSLQHEDDLLKEFLWLVDHEEQIKTHLADVMPNYIDCAWQAEEVLTQL